MGILTGTKLNKKEKISQEKKRESAGKAGTENAASGSKRKLLIKQVWITEKASNSSNFGKYVFVVDKSANKSEIKKAIESIYSVKVVGVNTVNSKSKSKRLGRSTGKTSGYKKAIVALKEGQKIDIIPT